MNGTVCGANDGNAHQPASITTTPAPIRIDKNCWLGAGVMVMPGITIGDNTVVGAGSIVTKDLPSGVLAVGNPCRVLRVIGEHERKFYFKDKRIPAELLMK